LKFTLNDNRDRNTVQVELLILPGLQRILDVSPTGGLNFLVAEYGAFTAAGFGNKFPEWCNEAGTNHCFAHGRRKAAANLYSPKPAQAPTRERMVRFDWKDLTKGSGALYWPASLKVSHPVSLQYMAEMHVARRCHRH